VGWAVAVCGDAIQVRGAGYHRVAAASAPAVSLALLGADAIAMTSPAKKVVLHTHVAWDRSYEPLLQGLLDRGIRLLCAVGVDCEAWEEAMDWTCIGPDGESRGFVVTTSHVGESLADVVAFAEEFERDETIGVEVIDGAEGPP